MRIVSLLPSLTELVHALGRGGDLVGVTHECDFPPGVERLPHLTRSRIAADVTSAEIDRLVAAQGGSLYELDADLLAALRPDLILTQEQCDVCAVNEATVRRAAASLPGSPHVESVNPTDLEGVLGMFRRVGELIGAIEATEALVGRFGATAAEVARRRAGRAAPNVIVLEWLDPPYCSGHWNPDLIALAGGREVLGRSGERSRRVAWADVAAARPEVLLVAPCGFDLDRARADLAGIADVPAWRDLPAVRNGRVTAIDGGAYFSRPGPRLEASLRIAAAAIDPEACGDLAPRDGWRTLAVTA